MADNQSLFIIVNNMLGRMYCASDTNLYLQLLMLNEYLTGDKQYASKAATYMLYDHFCNAALI